MYGVVPRVWWTYQQNWFVAEEQFESLHILELARSRRHTRTHAEIVVIEVKVKA